MNVHYCPRDPRHGFWAPAALDAVEKLPNHDRDGHLCRAGALDRCAGSRAGALVVRPPGATTTEISDTLPL